jgi:hypothetical protein
LAREKPEEFLICGKNDYNTSDGEIGFQNPVQELKEFGHGYDAKEAQGACFGKRR